MTPPKPRWTNDPTPAPQGQAERVLVDYPRCKAKLKTSPKGTQYCPRHQCRWPNSPPATPAKPQPIGGISHETFFLFFLLPSVSLVGMFLLANYEQRPYRPSVTSTQPAPPKSEWEREKENRQEKLKYDRAKRACGIGERISTAQIECFYQEYQRQP